MALPIMATPTLDGEDAERFYKELEKNEGKKLPEEEVRRGIEVYNAVVRRNPWLGRSPIAYVPD